MTGISDLQAARAVVQSLGVEVVVALLARQADRHMSPLPGDHHVINAFLNREFAHSPTAARDDYAARRARQMETQNAEPDQLLRRDWICILIRAGDAIATEGEASVEHAVTALADTMSLKRRIESR